MAKRKPPIAPSQRKLSVQDVRSTDTPVGIGMENEEMRRIAMRVNSLTDELDRLRPPAAEEGKKNPIVIRGGDGDNSSGGGDIIGGDTTVNINGGNWALTIISSLGRVFRERWVQAIRFVSGQTSGPSQPYFKVPVAFDIIDETIANDLKTDNKATQAAVTANSYLDVRKLLGSLRGAKSIFKDTSTANGYETLHGQPLAINTFELVNDLETPDPTYYYGTNEDGDKGWHDLVAVIEDNSGGGAPTFESRTIVSDTTVNKSDGWKNYVRLSNTGTAKVITIGTGFVAGDYFYFTFAQNTNQILFYIQSKYVSFSSGIFAIWFDGTNWNMIFPNQRSFSDSNVARGMNWGLDNAVASNGLAVGINCQAKGNLNIAYGDSVNMGSGSKQVGYGVNINANGTNNNTLVGNDINTSGSFNSITGKFANNSGNYNNVVVRESQNPDSKSYLKGFGHGVRFLFEGEIAYKIDKENSYKSSGYNSHLRTVNFGAITTNDTQTEIYLNDSVSADRLVIPAKSSYMIKGRMSAVQSDFSDIKHWEFSCSLLRDGSNNTSLQGSTHITVLQESTGAATWDILLSVDNTNESLKVEVVGQASQTIYWKGVFEIIDLMLP
jgi:hypothetical protein